MLKGVRVALEADRLFLDCTDLDLHLGTEVGGVSHPEGSQPSAVGIVYVGALRDVLTAVTADELAVEFTERALVLEAGTYRVTLRTMPAGDWPSPMALGKSKRAKLTAADVDLARRVGACASRDDCRPVLTGVRFGGTDIATTDSYRLAVATVSADMPEFLLPQRAVAYLPKSDDWRPLVGRKAITWEADGRTVTSHLIEGEFPNYGPLFPKVSPVEVSVDRIEMTAALRRLAPARSSKRSHTETVVFEHKGDHLVLTASVLDLMSIEDRVRVVAATRDLQAAAAFNAGFLADLLKITSGDTVKLGLNDEGGAVLKPLSVTDGALRWLLMPVRNVGVQSEAA